ncbi:MAG: competence/damage-inducible protein A [Calditrichaeota bacterium]|nr:MAG: competence/damage-inducible protein A [Calditrichota bacterium]
MKVAIISIGNELLNGRTINTNASYIGKKLFEIGIVVEQILTIRDEADAIRSALNQTLPNFDALILTGGLGPTHDDITKKVLADYFHSPMTFDETILHKIEERFRKRGMKMPETNREQAYFPSKAQKIENPIGTAPGMHFHQDNKHVFVLPGVPQEMERMTDEYIVPFLRKTAKLPELAVHLYRTTGIAESKIYQLCKELFTRYPNFEIAFLPKLTGVDVRIIERQPTGNYHHFEEQLLKIIGKYVYSFEEEELEEVIGKLLKQEGLTISVAESCTGGLIQDRITNVPGSSEYFMGGMVTYSNESKLKFLGVEKEILEKFGAVSEPVAEQMALGIRRVMGTDIGLSTTGIAGPTGATPEKPIGLLYVGLATPEKVLSRKFQLGQDRLINKLQGSVAALEYLRRYLLNLL